jgi:FKBP-type peptidyl-prolyl cis-trans isomerase FkpA
MMARIALLTLLLAGLALFASPKHKKDKKDGPPPVQGKPFVLPGDLKVWEIKRGTGDRAIGGMDLTVQYTGWLKDGTKFDSSLDRGEPYTFRLGERRVIQGWDEGITGMRVGGKRRLEIPPALAYGERGKGGDIPPNATLVFDIELLGVN